MYETPKLTRVGEAREVILGYALTGGDFDGSLLIPDMEWGDDFIPYPQD